jgi:arylsulfatase A-like enzyme
VRLCVLLLLFSSLAGASAYNARPRLIVVIVIDQFRGDYLERYRDDFTPGGFRTFLDRGANFANCNYDYANTRTAPGHATLFTGAYSNGHGIMDNEWWDPLKKRMVTSVEDESTRIVGLAAGAKGSSPHNLLAGALGDELKLATQGKSKVFSIALKDRAAVLPGGHAADAAYWIDQQSGAWITSTYYRDSLPKWAEDFNQSKRADKYLNQEWKDANGQVLRSTAPVAGKPSSFYLLVGSTPFANDHELDFARALITNEKLGKGPVTDLLTISLSANDILGHQVGPDSPELRAMILATDRQLAAFFEFLGRNFGLANVWLALSADHGVAPLPRQAAALRLPALALSAATLRDQLNLALSSRFSPQHPALYVKEMDYPLAWIDADVFAAANVNEEDAERATGEAMKQAGLRAYYTRSQLAKSEVPFTEEGTKYLHSYSPLGGWYVIGIPAPFSVATMSGTDHASPYTYDTHVPLSFYGLPFQPGTYRTHAEPVDLAPTLASLLGINAPTHSIGRVLTEALVSPPHPGVKSAPSTRPERIAPAVLRLSGVSH